MRPSLCIFTMLFFSGAILTGPPARATQVLPVNIADLAGRADTALVGKCIGAQAYLKNLPDGKGRMLVTTYTFSVSERIKGEIPDMSAFGFTQLGASPDEARRLGAATVIGMPIYNVGGEYAVFLTKESGLGLRSTVGMGQGKFQVITSKDGAKQVVNESGNKNLFVNLPSTKAMTKALSAGGIPAERAPAGGPVGYDSFMRIVGELVK